MKHLITVTIDGESKESTKADAFIISQAITKARTQTNGSAIYVYEENPENTEALIFLNNRIMKWSGGGPPPMRRKRVPVKKKGWLGKMKDEFIEGLTG